MVHMRGHGIYVAQVATTLLLLGNSSVSVSTAISMQAVWYFNEQETFILSTSIIFVSTFFLSNLKCVCLTCYCIKNSLML